MAAIVVDIFIPERFFTLRDIYYLFGCHKTFENHTIINCVFSCDKNNENYLKSLSTFKDIEEVLDCNVGIVGVLRNTFKKTDRISPLHNYNSSNISFILTTDQKTLEIRVEHLVLNGCSVNARSSRIVIYDCYHFINSQLLLSQQQNYITHFVSKGVQLCLTKASELELEKEELIFPMAYVPRQNIFLLCLYNLICSFILILRRSCDCLFRWWPKWFQFIYLNTAFGRQFHQKLVHLKAITDEMNSRVSLSLRALNIMSAILLDLLIGWIIVYILPNYVSSQSLLFKVMSATNGMVNELQKLIYWLMGVPAGLKLNIPVNSCLGHFFLYHIHLWKSYINIVQPLFEFALNALMSIGLLGASFIPCLVTDIISLATVHIYCFYGYAARLYYYQLYSITLLWRLFRGKKWNAELQRVESHTYNIHVLYIGTLVFTVLLFLLPTVMVYYFVFAALRIAVLVVQGIISRAVHVLTILPVFVILHRLFNSCATAGDIYFSVMKQDPTIILALEIIQTPFAVLIEQTLPSVIQHGEQLSWQRLLSCLIWGKIIYPL